MKAWINALRDGSHKQCKGFLRKDDAFCVLGVGLDILNPEGWINDDRYYFKRFDGDTPHSFNLSMSEREELGIDSEDAGKLFIMNDQGKSFAELADYLEEKYAD